MNLINISVPKDRISMIFDAILDAETCNTTLYLHKSKITFEDGDMYSAKLEIDLNQDIKNDKMVQQTICRDYGSFITTFLNADFTNAENAYNTFFVYYGLEGFNFIDEIKEKYSIEYTARYVSTKKFLDYYNKAFKLVKTDYIKFQKDIRNTVDFVFNLHGNQSLADLDRVSKFMAYSTAVDLLGQFNSEIRFAIIKSFSEDIPSNFTNIKQIEKLAYDIANKKINSTVGYLYESKSHFALVYIALNDLIQNSKRNISICQNCGRYYLQYSGKEVYCELSNSDGTPSCKSYASRKAYDNKIEEDVAELTYKREYQRRITQVYRADSIKKPLMSKDFKHWKLKAREQLKLYRENKITEEQFCTWIEENKN